MPPQEEHPSSGGSNDSSHTVAPAEADMAPGPAAPRQPDSPSITRAALHYSTSAWLQNIIQATQPLLQAITAAGLNSVDAPSSYPVATAEDLLKQVNKSCKSSKQVHRTLRKQLRQAIAQARNPTSPHPASPGSRPPAAMHSAAPSAAAPSTAPAGHGALPKGTATAAPTAAVAAPAAAAEAKSGAVTLTADAVTKGAPEIASAEAEQPASIAQPAGASKQKKTRSHSKAQAAAEPTQGAVKTVGTLAASVPASPPAQAPKEMVSSSADMTICSLLCTHEHSTTLFDVPAISLLCLVHMVSTCQLTTLLHCLPACPSA